MADSITPAHLPAGMDAYAGYVDGQWPDFPLIQGEHPGVPTLSLTVYLANEADGIDIEDGNASPSDAPSFVRQRTAAGVWRPVLYEPQSDLAAVKGACDTAGIARAGYRLWSAHYGAGRHICGPTTCGAPVQADGTQWTDHGPWDESVLAGDFFGTVPLPPPAAPVLGPTYPEDSMQPAHVQVQVRSGHGHCASPFPKVVSVLIDDIDPAVAGRYPVVPAFTGPAGDGQLMFGPGGDGPAADGNYGFVVWGIPAS